MTYWATAALGCALPSPGNVYLCMCVYIHTHTYIYTCTYIVYIYMCIHMIYIYICIYIYIYTHNGSCPAGQQQLLCTHCQVPDMCVYIYIHTHTYIHMHIYCIHIHVYTYVYIHKDKYITGQDLLSNSSSCVCTAKSRKCLALRRAVCAFGTALWKSSLRMSCFVIYIYTCYILICIHTYIRYI